MKWPTVELKNITTILMGQSPPGESYNETGDGLPFFQGKAEFGEVSPIVMKWCNKPIKIAEPGDILLSVRAPVGPTNLASQRCCIGRGLAAIRTHPNVVDQDYVRFFFKYYEPLLSRRGQGSTFTAISRKDIEELQVPFPPLSEQQRIVEILDRADALRRKRAEADRLMERIGPALFIKMFGDPATNPRGWKVSTLVEAGASVRYGLGQPPKVSIDGVPLIRATNIHHGTIVEKDLIRVEKESVPKNRNAFLLADEVIVVRSGAYTGDVAQVTDKWAGSVIGYDLVINPGSTFCGEFVEAYLLTPHIQNNYFDNLKARAGQPHLNAAQLSATPVLLPPKELQLCFAKRMKNIREMRLRATRMDEAIESLFTLLLHHAFSGELTAKWREAHQEKLLAEMEDQARRLESGPVQLALDEALPVC